MSKGWRQGGVWGKGGGVTESGRKYAFIPFGVCCATQGAIESRVQSMPLSLRETGCATAVNHGMPLSFTGQVVLPGENLRSRAT